MRKRGSTLESNSSTDPYRVGRLGKPNGLDGFLGLYADTEHLIHFAPGSVVSVDGDPHTVRELRHGKKGPQVAFEDVVDRPGAELLRGREVFVDERRTLGEGEFWPGDLVGLDVRPGGGTVVEVAHGAAQDRLVIERDGARFEVPFVGELVPVVDLDIGFVEVVEIEGLSSPTDPG
ncbi:MAG TPA: ribosome maturation factor RimM [Acidimicrobiia bacterium]|nr:ribosome maturation factor RimM [Acidimicrobiia bacterium]